MHDPKALEQFFLVYMPRTKELIENLWKTDRKELSALLQEFITYPSWINPYFQDLDYYVRSAPHTYTSPWDVL